MCDLIALYREKAALHGNLTFLGNSRKTNLAYKSLHKILAELVSNGSDNLLFSLYEDRDLSVQLWAAAHTLELDERRAIDKLHQIASLKEPIVSMSARLTAKGWNEGEVSFRPSQV
jgi:hypothetical protein